MNTFTLSRNFCNFAFDNPEKINPGHYAIYFFAIEHCNRLGWKEKFGFPSQMVMEATGIKNWRTYQKYLQDLIDFGFIKMIEVSKNQYSSNIIAIVKNTKALDKALDKALQKHHTKHSQSIDSIDIQETILQETRNNTTIVVEQALVEKEEYGNKDINKTLSYISKAVGCTTFKESQAQQRIYGRHLFNLGKQIGIEEFNSRLKEILSDQFKAKNCNKLAYLYGELKSFIHSPVIEPTKKERFITSV